MKIGDKVRFLSEMGGGKVAGFQGKDIVLVEDEDGFEIQMRINDVVVVQSDDYNSRNALTAKMQQAESKQQAMSDGRSIKAMMHAGQEDVANEASAAEFDTVDLDKEITYRAPVEERKGGNLLTACLAFVPVNINEMTTTRFDLYFVNDSNYFINYVMLTADGANWSVFSQGEVEPNTKAYIEEIGKEDLDSLSRVCIQMFAYKREKSFVLKPAIDVQFRIDGVKFYKLHTFIENIYFESPALIYNIVENDQPIRSLVVDAKKLKQEMYKSANADANTNLQADNGNNDGYVRRYDDGKKHGNPFVVKRRGDEDVVVVGSPLDALDEWSLYGVEDIDFVPLEEEVGQRYALAGDEVSGAVCGEHGVACDADHEVGALECGYDIALAVVFHDGYAACECASHGRDGDEGNALAAALWDVVGCLDRMVVVCGLEHGALASEEPMCINIEL